MKLFVCFVVVCATLAFGHCENAEEHPHNKTTTSTTPTSTSTTTPKPTTTSTPAPSSSTTTSTPAPSSSSTTSTPAPSSSSTPAPSTTTPTPAPSSSSTLAPSTTTPTPAQAGHWTVNDTNRTCILLNGYISIELFNSTTHKLISTINVPSDASTNGSSCQKEELRLSSQNCNLTLTFNKTDKYFLHQVSGAVKPNDVNFTKPVSFANNNLTEFKSPLDRSYVCEYPADLHISNVSDVEVVLKLNSFQYQAFKGDNKNEFSIELNCRSPSTPSIVPIIVGCVLAILVVLVLTAYLVKRRLSQGSGYTSM